MAKNEVCTCIPRKLTHDPHFKNCREITSISQISWHPFYLPAGPQGSDPVQGSRPIKMPSRRGHHWNLASRARISISFWPFVKTRSLVAKSRSPRHVNSKVDSRNPQNWPPFLTKRQNPGFPENPQFCQIEELQEVFSPENPLFSGFSSMKIAETC